MTLLLTKSFTEGIVPRDDADRWALLHERTLRELRWRKTEREGITIEIREETLAELLPATDAGQLCNVCGTMVTWTDHLPALEAGGPVRCFVDVVAATGIRANVANVVALKPGERRVGDAIVYSAEFLSGPEAVS